MNIIEFNPQIIKEFGLGLLATQTDDRNKNFPLKSILPKKVSLLNAKYWPANGWWGNQENTSECTAFSSVQWLEDSPITHKGPSPIYNPHTLYNEFQSVDEWAGTPHEGSSTLASMKVLQAKGYVGSYYWGYTLNDLIEAILSVSCCLVGTVWFEQMFYPDSKGLIKIGGDIAGGHQYIINGGNKKTKLFRGKSSWGDEWSPKKNFYISFADMERLIGEQGEISIALEIKT